MTDIVTISDESIQPSPTFLSNIYAKYLTGIAKIDHRMIIILNPELILSTEEYAAIGQ